MSEDTAGSISSGETAAVIVTSSFDASASASCATSGGAGTGAGTGTGPRQLDEDEVEALTHVFNLLCRRNTGVDGDGQ